MFSRRHPYLFFILTFSAIMCGAAIFLSLIVRIGASGADFTSGEKVGVVEITGVIAESKEIMEQIKAYREDDAIRAIVLRIDSPGGGVGPSQEIYREVRKTVGTKKVIASMGAVAASGGYYIASAADGIIANPGTITGSIGVIMGYTDFQDIFKKIGLVPVVIKSGEYKDMGSPLREMRPEEKKIFQNFVSNIHEQFVKDVATGRKLELDKVRGLADGRIYTGEEAKQLGLIDRLGNLEDAIQWAGREGGIKGKISAVYPPEKTMPLLDYLTGASAQKLINKYIQPDIKASYIFRP